MIKYILWFLLFAAMVGIGLLLSLWSVAAMIIFWVLVIVGLILYPVISRLMNKRYVIFNKSKNSFVDKDDNYTTLLSKAVRFKTDIQANDFLTNHKDSKELEVIKIRE